MHRKKSCLLFSSHPQPVIKMMANTCRDNDHFICKHATHFPKRLHSLTDKESVRQVLNSTNAVDLVATNIPTAAEAIGTTEQEGEVEEKKGDQNIRHNTTTDIENEFHSHMPIATHVFRYSNANRCTYT